MVSFVGAMLTQTTRFLAPLTLIAAAIAYFQPSLFMWLQTSLSWLFAATMFALGIVIEPEELGETVRTPGRIGLGVLAQYTIMPLLGLMAAIIAKLPPELALGFVLVGSAPGAMASNVIVYLAGGAVAYSVSLTVVATLLSPLATPFLVQQLGGAFMEIDFVAMMIKIMWMVVIPLISGLLIRRYLGPALPAARALAPAIAAISIVLICAFVVAANRDRLADLGPVVILLVVLMNALGYMLGWLYARFCRFDHQHRITLSIEIGMQNAGMGVVLAATQFPGQSGVALPAALFAFWSVITAAATTAWLRRQPATDPVRQNLT